jgi:hypothetical protein
MNLFTKLQEREAEGRPIIFIRRFARLAYIRAIENLKRVGCPQERYRASSIDDALKNRTTFLIDDWRALVA